jgi:hypothetical protein
MTAHSFASAVAPALRIDAALCNMFNACQGDDHSRNGSNMACLAFLSAGLPRLLELLSRRVAGGGGGYSMRAPKEQHPMLRQFLSPKSKESPLPPNKERSLGFYCNAPGKRSRPSEFGFPWRFSAESVQLSPTTAKQISHPTLSSYTFVRIALILSIIRLLFDPIDLTTYLAVETHSCASQ